MSLSLFQLRSWLGDSRSFAARPTDINSESATEAEVGEAGESWSGHRQLAASRHRRGQFLLAEGSKQGMILLILLGGRQKWSSVLSRNVTHICIGSVYHMSLAHYRSHWSPSQQYQCSYSNPELWRPGRWAHSVGYDGCSLPDPVGGFWLTYPFQLPGDCPQAWGKAGLRAPHHFSRKTSCWTAVSQNPYYVSTSFDHEEQFIPWKKAVPQTGGPDSNITILVFWKQSRNPQKRYATNLSRTV